MSNWFNRIKKYYDAGLWTEKMVGNEMKKKKNTADENRKITVDDIMYPNNIYIKNSEPSRSTPAISACSWISSITRTASSTTRWRVPSTSTGAPSRPVCRSC